MDKEKWQYRKCPFCGKKHHQKIYLNIICSCGAKYYIREREWLQRNAEERKDNG